LECRRDQEEVALGQVEQINQVLTMDHPSTIVLIALGILALVAIAFFAVFRGKGKVQLKGPGGVSLRAEGANPSQASAVPVGVRIKDAEAGQNVQAHATGSGGVDLEKVKAKGSISASSAPGASPPKM